MKLVINLNRVLICAVSLAGTVLWAQTPQSTRFPPQLQSVLSRPFPQTKVTDCVDASQGLAWKNAIQLSYSSEGLSIAGMDAAGAKWKTTIPASGVLTCEVWSAKLTGEGADDLMVLNYGHSHDGFDAELTILLFDAQERPVPWRAIGHFISSSSGITEVASGSISAVITVSTKVGDRWDSYAYISSLYEASSTGLHLVTGSRSGAIWPIISGKTSLLSGSERKNTMSVDLNGAENKASVAGKLEVKEVTAPVTAQQTAPRALDSASMRTARVAIPDNSSASNETKILLSDQTSTLIPRIVVADQTDGTRLIFFAQNVEDGVNKLLKGHYSVRMTGQSCEEEDCHPFILWGTQK